LAKTDDPASIDVERAIELIEEKKKKESERLIKTFPENDNIQVLNGRFGPYFAIGKSNYKIPKGKDPAALTLEECLEIAKQVDANPKPAGKSKFRKK
jgi:DNA topoisomerase-1